MNFHLTFRNTAIIVLFLIPIIYFIYKCIMLPVNIPFNDDFQTILDYLIAYSEPGINSKDKFELLFITYAEHRVILLKLLALAQISISDYVDFRILTIFGSLSCLIFFYFIVSKYIRSDFFSYFYIIPLGFILLNFQSYSLYSYATVALQHGLVLFMVGGAFYFAYTEPNKIANNIIVLLFGIFGILTSAVATFVFLIISLVHFFNNRFKHSLFYFLAFIAIFKINSSDSSSRILDNLYSSSLLESIGKFFVLVGSVFHHPAINSLAIIIGACFVFYFIYLFFYKKYYKDYPFFTSLFLFSFLACFAIVIQRSHFFIHNVTQSRYRIYGTIILALVYISFTQITNFKHKKLNTFLLIPFFIIVWLVSNIISIDKFEKRNISTISSVYQMESGIKIDSEFTKTYLKSIELKIIKPAGILSKSMENILINKNIKMLVSNIEKFNTIDTSFIKNQYWILRGITGLKDYQNTQNTPFLIVYRKGKCYYFLVNYTDVTKYVGSTNKELMNYSNCGYLSVMNIDKLKEVDSIYIGISRDVLKENIIPIEKINYSF